MRKPRSGVGASGAGADAEQIDALVQAAVAKTPAYAGIIATAAYTGARVREVLALRWQDIDHDAKTIALRGQLNVAGTEVVSMKTAAGVRVVKLTPKLEAFLGRAARLKSPWSEPGDFVFSAARGKPRQYRNLRRALTTASKAADLPGVVRMHDLQHSFTSLMIQHTDLQTVANAVGHANILVTARVYSHAIGSLVERAEKAALAAVAAGLG